MTAPATSFACADPVAILDRHTVRRTAGIGTVSLLVGPVGISARVWRRWADAAGRAVIVAMDDGFPLAACVRSIAEKVDLPAAAVECLARRAGRDPDEFLAAWLARTPADHEHFWSSLPPEADDELLRAAASQAADQRLPDAVAASLSALGERIGARLVRLAASSRWPSVLFVAGSSEDLSAIGPLAAEWVTRMPVVPVALLVPAEVWDEYLTVAPESRTKALLREGELRVPVLDAATIERTLREAGAGESAIAALTANGADSSLVEAAVSAALARAAPPRTAEENDRARSAAERFLFTLLESLPETASRFELNACLDFSFGRRSAEVDLLCRSPRIAIELDGYFHFLAADGYRRDRAKDWELQRRGYLVLRFLAEDVIPQLEMIRDRILDALAITTPGAYP